MSSQPINIDGFVIDAAFVDASKAINGIMPEGTNQVASLTQKVLSYFYTPSAYADKRPSSARSVSWFVESTAEIMFDSDRFGDFVGNINALSQPISTGVFKLIDQVFFNYDPAMTSSQLEAALVNDPDIAQIYVPASMIRAATVVQDSVYHLAGTTSQVFVPSFCKFALTIPVGATTKTYVLTLYTSVEAFLKGYDFSTILKVIPPLPYERIYTSSLINSTDNLFNIATLTANLLNTTTNMLLGAVSVSGITPYNAVIVDNAGNSVGVPFNILYKGRAPTLSEIRLAIRTALTTSGVGDAAGWEKRIPGVFVAGRFYIVPYWDETYTKPNQVLYPNIHKFTSLSSKLNTILDSTGFGDLTSQMDVLSSYFNTMTLAAVPDLTGVLAVTRLISIIPDYQHFSPQDEEFVYMTAVTQNFAKQLGAVLALDANNTTSPIYIPITENLLTFRSFVVEKYEVCVITKQCYTDIMESIQ